MSYSLLFWQREPFNGGITYISDFGGFSITAEYPTTDFEADAKEWQLFNHNGYSISIFKSLEEAQNHAEYLYETRGD